MAMYTKTHGSIYKVEFKISRNGLKYADVCINIGVFNNPFFINAKVYSRKVSTQLKNFDSNARLYCKLILQSEGVVKDDNYYQNWTVLSLEKIDENTSFNSYMENEELINETNNIPTLQFESKDMVYFC